MQPPRRAERPGRMSARRAAKRLLVIVVLVLASATLPIAKVAACSCAGFGSPEEVVAASAVTFIGTVVDTAPGGPTELSASTVRYAFDVERASAATDALIVVRAEDFSGGSTCAVEFGMGERWLVAASRQEGELGTSLCSGNRLVRELPPVELAAYEDLLSEVPPPPAETAEPIAGFDLTVPAVIAVLGTLLLGAVTLLALRQRKASSG